MKNSILRRAIFALPIIAFASGASAQLNVPSDGSDGALNITTNTVIDLSQATTCVWSQDNSTNAGKGVYDPAKWAVVFKYSSVNVASNATVTFANHPSHAPIVWLAQGSVTINGTLSLDGHTYITAYPNSLLPTEPAPGGFRGGALGSSYGAGYGPGGGQANGSSGSNYGDGYGNPEILPLLGGSGGGSSSAWSTPYAAASGGGAILVAAGNAITINGTISAAGQSPYGYTDSGGGAIRLVANQILGSGTVSAARTRTEANSISPQLVITPNTVAVPPGTTPVVWPPTNSPTVSIVSVNSVNAPTDPLAAVATSSDLYISTNSAVAILLQTQNFPPNGSVSVRVTPKYGNYWNVSASYVSGNFSASTWKATTTPPSGFFVLQAHATSP